MVQKRVTFHDEIAFDDGTRVLINRLLDKGEFRSVYLARDVKKQQLYALKRVDCQSNEEVERCREEAAIHRLFHHENIMPLLNVKFAQTEAASSCSFFYMLFPYLPRSLEDEITARRLREDRPEKQRRPFSTLEALTIFAGVCKAIKALHDAGVCHRDVCPGNILLQNGKRRIDVGTPVLSDFGSVGPLSKQLSSQADVANAKEDVERSTTPAYRAPELFELIEQYKALPSEQNLQYGPADVWSLGCLLFAMLYGMSPIEMDWRVSLVEGAEADGTVQFWGTTYERVLEFSEIPFPPDGSAADRRYGDDIKGLISWMLNKEWQERPSVGEVLDKVGNLLAKKE